MRLEIKGEKGAGNILPNFCYRYCTVTFSKCVPFKTRHNDTLECHSNVKSLAVTIYAIYSEFCFTQR